MQADRLATQAAARARPRTHQDESSMIKFATTHPAEPIRTHPAILANIQLERRTSEPASPARPNSISKQLGFDLHNDLEARSASQEGAAGYHSRLASMSAPLERPEAEWSLASAHELAHLELDEEEEEKQSGAGLEGGPPGGLDGLAKRLNNWQAGECEYECDNEPAAKRLEQLKREFERFLETHLQLEQDRLELAVYLNEYETNACDLSELLTNILRNLFVPDKLKRPAIKCKLLHYIKRLYIEPRLGDEPGHSVGGFAKLMGEQRVGEPAGAPLSSSDERALEGQPMSAAGKFELDLKLFNAMIRRYQLANQVVEADESMLFGVGSMSDLVTRSRRPDNASDCDQLADNHGASRRAVLRNLELPNRAARHDLDHLTSLSTTRSAQPHTHTLNGFTRRQYIPLNGTSEAGPHDQNIARSAKTHFTEQSGPDSEALNFRHYQQKPVAQKQQQQQQQHIEHSEVRGSELNDFGTSCDDEWVSSARELLPSDTMRTSAYSASLDSLQDQLAGRLEGATRAFVPPSSATGDLMLASSRGHLHQPEAMSPPMNASEFEYSIQATGYNPDELVARLSTPPDRHGLSRFHHETPLAQRKQQYVASFDEPRSCDCASCLESASASHFQPPDDLAPFSSPAEWAGTPRHISSSSTQRCHSSMSIPLDQTGALQATRLDWTSTPAPPPQMSSGQLLNYETRLGAAASNYQTNGYPNWPHPASRPHWIGTAYSVAGGPMPISHSVNGAALSLPGSPESLMKQHTDWPHFDAFNEAPAPCANQLDKQLHWPPENYQRQELRPTSAVASKQMSSPHQIRLIELGGQPSGTSQPARHRTHEPNQARRERRSQQSASSRQDQAYGNCADETRSNSIDFGPEKRAASLDGRRVQEQEEESEEDEDPAQLLVDGPAESLALVPIQAKGRLPMSVAEQMSEQASKFVQHYGSAASAHRSSLTGSVSAAPPTNQVASRAAAGQRQGAARASSSCASTQLQVRRTLRVKIRKSKPILGIAIEGGFNVSGQLLPRIVCVHEEGAAYQCGKLRASDLILEVNGIATANMTHDEIAETIANAYYQDERTYIEFLIGESVHV